MRNIDTPDVPHLTLDLDYSRRLARINERLDELGVSRAEVSRRIGRSYTYVLELLNGTETGAPTLALIEDLIEQIEEDA